MHTIYSDKRKSGISLIDSLTWGTNFCQFYRTEKDLLDILVPYFGAGLENNELCIWITPGPVGPEDPAEILKKSLPCFEQHVAGGRLEIIPGLRSRRGDRHEALISTLDTAISRGFDGLRLACSVLPEKENQEALLEELDIISRYNIIAAYCYPREGFDALTLMEVVKNHRFALVRNAGRWELIESSEVRVVRDALKKSEEKLESLFSNMSEGFAYHRIVLDAEGRPCDYVFHQVNKAFEKLTGLRRENIIGKRLTAVFPGVENYRTDWIEKCGEVALTGRPLQFETYAEPLEKWYSVSAFSPHKGYFAVTFADITDRKQTEQALRENEEKLRVTLRSIGDAVIATDQNGLVTFMNPVAETLTGWKQEEVLNRKLTEVFNIVNRDTLQPAENPAARVILEGKIVGLANHTVLIAKDGTEIPIDDSAAPIRDDRGNLIGVVLVFRDITEREKAEETLRRTKEEWELTFDTVPDLIAILDENHRIVRANRAMADRLGLRTDQCIGRLCFEVVHGTREVPAFCPHSLTCRDGRQHVAEINEPHLGGDFLVSTTPLTDPRGRITGSVHVARDITVRKQAEQELRRINDELELRVRERTTELQVSNKALMEYAVRLERLNEELRDFAFVAAHDLQEPLRKIQTFCDMAIKRCAPLLDDTGKEYLDRIVGSAGRMRQLLSDLLHFSKAAAGPGPVKEIKLGKIVQEAVDLFEEDLKATDGVVEVGAMPDIEADEDQMLRLFQNLISNALKFRLQSPRIRIHAENDGGQCEIYVRDNGIGFAPQYAERIFKPFQKLHSRNKYEGTGIGLAICRKIAEWHGGSIRAESEPGKGSAFIIRLPVRQGKGGLP